MGLNFRFNPMIFFFGLARFNCFMVHKPISRVRNPMQAGRTYASSFRFRESFAERLCPFETFSTPGIPVWLAGDYGIESTQVVA